MYHLVFCVILLNLLSTSTPLQASASSLGPLSEYVQPEDDGVWRVVDDGTSAFLENSETEGAITYYYVGSSEEEEGSRTISVDVGFGQSTQWSSAGLLYGFHENPKTYYMFTVRGDSTINIHQMVNGHFEELLVVSMDSLSAEKTILSIEENDNSVTLKVNDQTIDTYTDDQLGNGAVGIVAGDIGQYKFSNFRLTSKLTVPKSEARLSGDDFMPSADANAIPENNAELRSENQLQNAETLVRDNNKAGSSSTSSSSVEPKKYFAAEDKRFNAMVSNFTPYPVSWKQLPGNPEFYFAGPHGIKISNAFGQSFEFSAHPDGVQMLSMQGKKNTPPYSLQRILDEFYLPHAKKQNRELVKTYPLPAYTQTRTDFLSRLFKSVPVRETLNCYALEWKDDKGLSYITVLTVVVSEAFPVSTWSMQGQYLVAESAHFEQARDDFLYGLIHTEINPKWLQVVNQRDAQRSGRSWAAHNSRMAAIQSRAEASKSVADIYSEISDISHAGYLKRSSIQSQGQSASVRATSETTLITNQNTGERYEVEGNFNHHWVNTNGVHIATDNALFDPRSDEQLKMFEWSQFQKER